MNLNKIMQQVIIGKKTKSIFTLVLLMFSSGCINSEQYIGSGEIWNCKGLYTNVYDVKLWGIFNADNSRSVYITDSLHFRLYVGKVNEDFSYSYKVKGDKLFVIKNAYRIKSTPINVETRCWSLKALRKAHHWD